MKRLSVVASLLALVSLAVVVGWAFLFRSEIHLDTRGATVAIEREWGCVRRISIDENNDGHPESVSVFSGCRRSVPVDAQAAQLLVDEESSGRFNLEFRFDPLVGLVSARHDRDLDGIFEVELSGEEAGLYLMNWRREHRNGVLRDSVSRDPT